MELIQFAVLLSALLCSLVAGLVFTFAIVVMPGIKGLGDLAFLKSFKAMDRVIQNNQPIFMLVWLGSATVLLVSTMLGSGNWRASIESSWLSHARSIYSVSICRRSRSTSR